ncbi:MAG: hypothetical protein SFU86_06675 [Pirellulaceae bacterium]|nr:hypothetical protein [Pirellulaceae bacterium]
MPGSSSSPTSSRPAVAAGLVGALLLALFAPALFSDRSFALRDAAHYYDPLWHWTRGEWQAGRVPLWNPLENGGVPQAADTTSSLFYPGQLLFALPLDFAICFKMYVVGHAILAAAGAFWLARQGGASPGAAAVAAMSYAGGGSVLFQYCNPVYLVGAAWLPPVVLASDAMLRHGSRPAAIGLAVGLALMILGGDPQGAYHGLIVAALLMLLLGSAWLRRRLFRHRNDPETNPRPAWEGLLLLPAAALLAACLAAVQVLPSREATPTSLRALADEPRNLWEAASAGGGWGKLVRQPPQETHLAAAYDFSVGPWRLVELVWPNVSGRMYPTHRRWLSLLPVEGRIWTPSLYLGLVPLVLGLSVFRLWGGAEVRIRWLSWITLLFTLGSLGAYGLGWVAREIVALLGGGEDMAVGSPVGGVYWLFVIALPKYVYFRYPAKLLVVAALGLSQLAAMGWDRALHRELGQPTRGLRRTLLLLGGVSGVAAIVGLTCSRFVVLGAGSVDPTFGPFDSRGAWRDIIGAFMHTAVVGMAGWWLLRESKIQRYTPDAPARETENPRWRFGLVLVALDLAIANYWLVPTAPAALWREPSRAMAAIDPNSGRVLRLAGAWRPAEFATTGSPRRLEELIEFERDTLYPKFHLRGRVAGADSYGGLQAADYELVLQIAQEMAAPQADGTRLPHPDVLRMLGVEWLIVPVGSEVDFAEPTATPGVWRIPNPLPRAWIADSVEVQPPLPTGASLAQWREQTRAALFPSGKPRDFLHRPVIELSRPSPLIPSRDLPRIEEFCRMVHDQPQLVRIEVARNTPGTLILADRFAPGWRATVIPADPNRQPFETGIVRANRVLRGALVPQGRHTVEFCYEPASVVQGGVISAVSWTLVGVAALAAWLLRRARRHEARTTLTTGGTPGDDS